MTVADLLIKQLMALHLAFTWDPKKPFKFEQNIPLYCSWIMTITTWWHEFVYLYPCTGMEFCCWKMDSTGRLHSQNNLINLNKRLKNWLKVRVSVYYNQIGAYTYTCSAKGAWHCTAHIKRMIQWKHWTINPRNYGMAIEAEQPELSSKKRYDLRTGSNKSWGCPMEWWMLVTNTRKGTKRRRKTRGEKKRKND